MNADILKKALHAASSLRLTVFLLGCGVLLIFFATLDQTHWGIQRTQKLYFETWIAWSPIPTLLKTLISGYYDSSLAAFQFPLLGGRLLGIALLVNLISAHVRYFRARWTHAGIATLHTGIILLILSALVAEHTRHEGQMQLDENGSVQFYSVNHHDYELTLIDGSHPEHDTVTSIPYALLKSGETLKVPELQLKVRVHKLLANAGISQRKNLIEQYEKIAETPQGWIARVLKALKKPETLVVDLKAEVALTKNKLPLQGLARNMDIVIQQRPEVHTEDEANLPAAVLEVLQSNGESLGAWVLSAGFGADLPAQSFEHQGKTYTLGLRFLRSYQNFGLQLLDFRHEKYPHTDLPKYFSSKVRLTDIKGNTLQEVLIEMNEPLYHEGLTFYQASFANNDTRSILQVVRNPAWAMPYLAITLVALGMVFQFSLSLSRFLKRRKSPKSKAKPDPSAADAATAAEAAAPAKANPQASAEAASNTNPQAAAKARWLPYLALLLGVLFCAMGLRAPQKDQGMRIAAFERLAVQSGGRVMPIGSFAENTLRRFSSKSRLRTEGGKKLSATQWLLSYISDPQKAAELPIFHIRHTGLQKSLTGGVGKKYFSFMELEPKLQNLRNQAARAHPKPERRGALERQVVQLSENLNHYIALQQNFCVAEPAAALAEYQAWNRILIPGKKAFENHEKKNAYDKTHFQYFTLLTSRYLQLSQISKLGIVPPLKNPEAGWLNLGEGLLGALSENKIPATIPLYAELAKAYQGKQADKFNAAASQLKTALEPSTKVQLEARMNNFAPFMRGIVLYLIVFLLIGLYWLSNRESLRSAATKLCVLAFVLHTLALLARMYLQGRPPVTNLYSSAIFIGWMAVGIGLLLERFSRRGLGAAAAALLGCTTLIIAHNLATTGADTLEQMRAVLDSNFWLATHVIVITMGYAATFLAGTLAAFYILQNAFFAPSPERASMGQSLYAMGYGTTCFALLFSFVGTMLGGIWADESWGRFWGWDPKENGALMIVLWCALMLHARWGGLVRARGFMVLALMGNCITAWSWFGVNMLGIGLHSYGFTDKAFVWLSIFWASQVLLMALASTASQGSKKA